ncbi:type VI secretion system amidase effector protein Tae4 [Robbsia andropogonis]|uniref:type VI secretion system amidase effector protein Tae4 n=1 Tax=Robbsia andropogonis TaxID=28092 RepID=UPI002A6AA4DD|nr:type VI secretion system amidase effector protein Tae4 [Robbsia andropogonis]
MPHTKHSKVTTHAATGSQWEIPVKAITFQELWSNYPSGDPYDNPAYTDQCAIRMSVTLHRVGVEMKSFSQKTVTPMSGSPTIGRIILDGKPTATRADELGEWLEHQPFAGLPKAEDITGPDWESKVQGRTGIIQFSHYWTRTGEAASDASGGHIDLWNGSRLTVSSAPDAIATFGRVIGIQSIFPGARFGFSDLRNSKRILFWEIK